MMEDKKLTGIFGGSFNPIHTGHIELARQLLKKLSLKEIWFVVSPLNPFKKASADLLDDEKRLLMTQMALGDEPDMLACDYEFHLPRPSYMLHTLQHLSVDYPDRQFALIIGADNWLAFERWFGYKEILEHYPVFVYPRQGYDVDELKMPTGVTYVDTPLFNLSSTEIRQLIKQNESLKGLIPEKIIPMVKEYYG